MDVILAPFKSNKNIPSKLTAWWFKTAYNTIRRGYEDIVGKNNNSCWLMRMKEIFWLLLKSDTDWSVLATHGRGLIVLHDESRCKDALHGMVVTTWPMGKLHIYVSLNSSSNRYYREYQPEQELKNNFIFRLMLQNNLWFGVTGLYSLIARNKVRIKKNKDIPKLLFLQGVVLNQPVWLLNYRRRWFMAFYHDWWCLKKFDLKLVPSNSKPIRPATR
jgi:hypothetical protein